MKKHYFTFSLVCLLFLGCATVSEPFKKTWGSSTKALEEARPRAAVKNFGCGWKECFDKVLEVAKLRNLTVFISDPKKPLIVLMGIPGSINTTEVGIFFSEPETGKAKLEIVSLSPTAQEATAKLLSKELTKTFSEL